MTKAEQREIDRILQALRAGLCTRAQAAEWIDNVMRSARTSKSIAAIGAVLMAI